MGLRARIEEEIRAVLRAVGEANRAAGDSRINVTSRVNRVVVRNVGGGRAAASAEQVAPIVQEPPDPPEQASSP